MSEEQKSPLSSDEVEELNSLRALVRSAGWKHFVELCNEAEFTDKQEILLKPLMGPDDAAHPMTRVIQQEYTKGFVACAFRLTQLPALQIAVLEERIEMYKENEDD